MKKLLMVCLAVLMCFSVAACGNPFEKNENTEGKVVIKVGVLGTTTEQEIFRKYKNGFQEKYSDVVVQLDPIPGGYSTGMDNYVQNKSFPDVVFTPGDQHAAYSSKGHFLDLQKFDEADETFSFDAIYPELIETTHYNTSDQGIWFMPRDYNKVVTFVNKTMLELIPGENGKPYAGFETFENLKQNWNTETFYAVCAAVKKKVDANVANPQNVPTAEKQAGLIKDTYAVDARYNWSPSYEAMVRHYGGKVIDVTKMNGSETDYSQVLSVDTVETVTAYRELYKNLSKPGYIKQTLSSGGVSAFPNKKAAFWFTTRPSWGDVISANATFDVDFLPFPYDYVGVGCSGYAISKLAESRVSKYAATKDGSDQKMTNADYAWMFLKYIASEEGQDEFGKIGMGVPSLISMKEKGEWMKYGGLEINHKAFVENTKGQTVVSVNDIYSFPATAQKTVSDNMISIMSYVVKDAFWPNDLSLEVNSTNYSAIYAKIKQYKDTMMVRINAAEK